jgi:hypothetical protein
MSDRRVHLFRRSFRQQGGYYLNRSRLFGRVIRTVMCTTIVTSVLDVCRSHAPGRGRTV